MKIINAIPSKANQTVQAIQTRDSNFEMLITPPSNVIPAKAGNHSAIWLKDNDRIDPHLRGDDKTKRLCTKQTTGEQYYWTHQHQLQQSALRFEPQAINKHHQLQNTTPDIAKRNSQEPPATPMAQTPKTRLADSNLVLYHNPRLKAPLPKEALIPQAISSKTPATQSLQQSFKPNQSLAIKAPTSHFVSLTKPIDFNKHHLFIKDLEAELTLNTQGLTSKEEKELIQLIQHHLKQKGVALTHLIINGVTL